MTSTTSTFVKIGDRVTIYDDPYTMTRKEGSGRIVDVHEQSDMESAYVDVWFDNDGDEHMGPYPRWVLPRHVERRGA